MKKGMDEGMNKIYLLKKEKYFDCFCGTSPRRAQSNEGPHIFRLPLGRLLLEEVQTEQIAHGMGHECHWGLIVHLVRFFNQTLQIREILWKLV